MLDRLFMHFRSLHASDSFLLKTVLIVLFAFVAWLFISESTKHQVAVPAYGGSLTEGVVGTPRFINPVLAVTRADKDMTALVYDGIMKLGPSGELVPDLARSMTLSNDGLTYAVTLRDNVTFHDNTPLTAEDVFFTISKIQDPGLNSPLRASFENVRVELLSPYELNFILPEPYAPFAESLTFGVLPKHIWKDASNEEFPFSQYNSEPVGTGPYRVAEIKRDTSGIPEAYQLTAFTDYHRTIPNIETLTLRFYTNESQLLEAFSAGEIDSFAGVDQSLIDELLAGDNAHHVEEIPLPRTFALFFNQNKSVALRDLSVRRALDAAIDRAALVEAVLGGYGAPLTTPLPPGFGLEQESTSATTEDGTPLDRAHVILEDGGWKLNVDSGLWEKEIDKDIVVLSFSIATANTPVFTETAHFLQTEWEKLGVPVTIKQFEQSDLTQAVIRPREYEALLFGTDLGRTLDFYAFWHSSERNDPGLNVALYANITTDAALEKLRTETDEAVHKEALVTFIDEVDAEVPALFLYSPKLLYVFPTKVANGAFAGVAEPSERFASVAAWSINTDSVWPFFKE